MGWIKGLVLVLSMVLAGPATAQPPVSQPLQARAQSLVQLFNGKAAPDQIFSATFLSHVPAAQMNAIMAQLREQLGKALAVDKIEARSPTAGSLSIGFEKGILKLNLAVAPAAPHLIEGLLITGTEVRGDSFEKVISEVQALPGRASLAAAKLGGEQASFLARHRADQPLAIGSAFKLFLLAELARSVSAGERKWTDVVPLTHHSLPSGLLQSWPKGAPLTLHSLAALMISQSDNTATDNLLHALGREKVEAFLPALGVRAAGLNRPLLSTLEAFALKTKGKQAFTTDWSARDEAGRRAQLRAWTNLRPDQVAVERLLDKPVRIDTVEWFASAEDLVRSMDWLRRNGGPTSHEILAINQPFGSSVAAEYGYLGYKGGSERGVINMTFLLRTRAGLWYALAGSWNDPTAPVDDPKFTALMSRALALLR